MDNDDRVYIYKHYSNYSEMYYFYRNIYYKYCNIALKCYNNCLMDNLFPSQDSLMKRTNMIYYAL